MPVTTILTATSTANLLVSNLTPFPSGQINVAQAYVRFRMPSTALGEAVQSLTVTVKNRNNVTQETLGPVAITGPNAAVSWLVQLAEAPGDVLFFFNYALSTAGNYPADHVILHFSAVGVSGYGYDFDLVAPIGGSSLFTVQTGHEPYADLQDAATYFSQRLHGRLWNQFAERDQWAALISATDDLDAERYKGSRSYATFAMLGATNLKWSRRQFPRLMEEFSYASIIDIAQQTVVPPAIRAACCEQALYLLKHIIGSGQDPADRRDLQQQGLTSIDVGNGINEAWDLARADATRIGSAARKLIEPYLATSAPMGYLD